jgi:hypothetical protein
MAFTIISTTNGPVVKSGSSHYTLHDVAACIDIAEANETFMDEMGTHIANELMAAATEWTEAFVGGVPASQNKVVYYMNAGNHFRTFVQQYGMYKRNMENPPPPSASVVVE